MENIPKTFMTIQTITFPLWFFKHTKMQFEGMFIHLSGSFDCVSTQIDFISYKLCIHDLYHIYMNNFC
jgi:hypothetical protein